MGAGTAAETRFCHFWLRPRLARRGSSLVQPRGLLSAARAKGVSSIREQRCRVPARQEGQQKAQHTPDAPSSDTSLAPMRSQGQGESPESRCPQKHTGVGTAGQPHGPSIHHGQVLVLSQARVQDRRGQATGTSLGNAPSSGRGWTGQATPSSRWDMGGLPHTPLLTKAFLDVQKV